MKGKEILNKLEEYYGYKFSKCGENKEQYDWLVDMASDIEGVVKNIVNEVIKQPDINNIITEKEIIAILKNNEFGELARSNKYITGVKTEHFTMIAKDIVKNITDNIRNDEIVRLK